MVPDRRLARVLVSFHFLTGMLPPGSRVTAADWQIGDQHLTLLVAHPDLPEGPEGEVVPIRAVHARSVETHFGEPEPDPERPSMTIVPPGAVPSPLSDRHLTRIAAATESLRWLMRPQTPAQTAQDVHRALVHLRALVRVLEALDGPQAGAGEAGR